MAMVSAAGWLSRQHLHKALVEHPALVPAAVTGLVFWLLLGGAILIYQDRAWAQEFRKRLVALTGIRRVTPESSLRRWVQGLPDPFEWMMGPLLRTNWGQRLQEDWRLSGFGVKGSRYLLFLLGSTLLAGWLAFQVGGLLLAVALALMAPLAPYRLVTSRAQRKRSLFGQQVPSALDAIAAGASAGLSFQQAIHFAAGELMKPMKDHLASVDRKIRLGHQVDEVLAKWTETADDEGLKLAVDGILLQRQMGGDLIKMLQQTAQLARERIELQREVQAVTAQGRLSGWVIGGLVPISAAILLGSNPRYIDVLFDTLLGQVLLVVAMGLQLIGWLVISRLIRVRY
jgi:tight adherence protein B